MYNQEIKHEQTFLDETIHNIDNQSYIISDLIDNRKQSFKEGKSLPGDDVALQTANKDLLILEAAKSEPYFGKIEIDSDENGKETFYIGKYGIRNLEEDIIVIDWRMPIASVYYNFTPGESIQEYTVDLGGRITKELVEVLNKKQFEIKNQKIMKIIQQVAEVTSESNGTITESGMNITVTDEVLRSILEDSETSGYLKEIIATIQREQDIAIRQSIDKNVIIQGVAGSGKSSIALHRLSYLLYNNKNMKPENLLILAPSELFIHSVQGLLPGLELSGIKQMTFNQLAYEALSKKFKLKKSYSYSKYFDEVLFSEGEESKYDFIKFKGSKEFTDLLEKHIERVIITYENNFKPISFAGEVLMGEDLLKIYEGYSYLPFFQQAQKFSQHVENYFKDILKQKSLHLQEKEEDIKVNFLNGGGLNTKEYQTAESLLKKVREYKVKHLEKDYETKIKALVDAMKPPNVLDIYNQLFVYLASDEYENEDVKKTLSHFVPGQLDYFDLAPLYYIHIYLDNDKPKYTHIVIDEAQDLSYIHFAALNRLGSTMTVIGDVEQSIFMEYGQQSWDEVRRAFFDVKDTPTLKLKTSYRSTQEIVGVANNVLSTRFGETREDIVPFSRSGESVTFDKVVNGTELFNKIIETLNGWQEKYKRIAIIHKDEQRAKALSDRLKQRFSDVQYLTLNDEENEKSISVLASYNSKGMEFDAVIIANANDTSYPNDDLHAKLLYVTVTRAQQALKVFYQNKPSVLLEGLIKTPVPALSDLDDIL